jgi:hypothetical protein
MGDGSPQQGVGCAFWRATLWCGLTGACVGLQKEESLLYLLLVLVGVFGYSLTGLAVLATMRDEAARSVGKGLLVGGLLFLLLWGAGHERANTTLDVP